MKTLEKLISVKKLSKKEQLNIKGGSIPDQFPCIHPESCGEGFECRGGICVPEDQGE